MNSSEWFTSFVLDENAPEYTHEMGISFLRDHKFEEHRAAREMKDDITRLFFEAKEKNVESEFLTRIEMKVLDILTSISHLETCEEEEFPEHLENLFRGIRELSIYRKDLAKLLSQV